MTTREGERPEEGIGMTLGAFATVGETACVCVCVCGHFPAKLG